MGDGAGSAGGETAGAIGSGGAGGGLPQQVAVHAGAQSPLQRAPQGKAARFAVERATFFEKLTARKMGHLTNFS